MSRRRGDAPDEVVITEEEFLELARTEYRRFCSEQLWGEMTVTVEFKNGDAREVILNPRVQYRAQSIRQ